MWETFAVIASGVAITALGYVVKRYISAWYDRPQLRLADYFDGGIKPSIVIQNLTEQPVYVASIEVEVRSILIRGLQKIMPQVAIPRDEITIQEGDLVHCPKCIVHYRKIISLTIGARQFNTFSIVIQDPHNAGTRVVADVLLHYGLSRQSKTLAVSNVELVIVEE